MYGVLRKILMLAAVCGVMASQQAFALRDARPLPIDSRLRIMVYNPNDIFKFIGHYGFQSSIEFDKTEEIQTISMGDSLSWQVVPSGYRIFLKPIEESATTNMTVITSKRVYQFELHAEHADDIRDDSMVFAVRFVYPDEGLSAVKRVNNFKKPDLEDPEKRAKYNFNYTLSGSNEMAPTKVFDDGEFTYFEFPKQDAEVPAFFLVDPEGNESLINYRVVDNYIVVERVGTQFTLRHGGDVTCVFNEARPFKRKQQ